MPLFRPISVRAKRQATVQRTPDAAVGNGGDGAHGHTDGSSAAGAVSRAMRYCSAAVEKGCSSSLQSAIALSRIAENILPQQQQQHRTKTTLRNKTPTPNLGER